MSDFLRMMCGFLRILNELSMTFTTGRCDVSPRDSRVYDERVFEFPKDFAVAISYKQRPPLRPDWMEITYDGKTITMSPSLITFIAIPATLLALMWLSERTKGTTE